MSDENPVETIKVDLSSWAEKVKDKPDFHLIRQAVEVLLTAVSGVPNLRNSLYLKGGVLMAVAYNSPRMTGDIDFTCVVDPVPGAGQTIEAHLNSAMRRAAAKLGNPDLLCRVQKIEERPRDWSKGTFEKGPALSMTVGIARQGTHQAELLQEKKSPHVLRLDISYKEPIGSFQEIIIEGSEHSVKAYSVTDLIAEKLRALLQQITRKHVRYRRQDVFDIAYILNHFSFSDCEAAAVLEALLLKSTPKGVVPTPESLRDPQVKECAAREWETMQQEIEEQLPDFESCYTQVMNFYESLPWDKNLAA